MYILRDADQHIIIIYYICTLTEDFVSNCTLIWCLWSQFCHFLPCLETNYGEQEQEKLAGYESWDQYPAIFSCSCSPFFFLELQTCIMDPSCGDPRSIRTSLLKMFKVGCSYHNLQHIQRLLVLALLLIAYYPHEALFFISVSYPVYIDSTLKLTMALLLRSKKS